MASKTPDPKSKPARTGAKADMPRLVTPMGVWERTTISRLVEGDIVSFAASNAGKAKVDSLAVTVDKAVRGDRSQVKVDYTDGSKESRGASSACWKLIEAAEKPQTSDPVAVAKLTAERLRSGALDAPTGPSEADVEAACKALSAELSTPEFAKALEDAANTEDAPPAVRRVTDVSQLSPDEQRALQSIPTRTENTASPTRSSSTPRAAKGATPSARLAASIAKFDTKMQPVMVALAKAIDADAEGVKDLLRSLCERPSLDGQPGSFGSGVAATLSWSLQEHRTAGKTLAGK